MQFFDLAIDVFMMNWAIQSINFHASMNKIDDKWTQVWWSVIESIIDR